MSDRSQPHPEAENVGAWLLGALDEDEARAFAVRLGQDDGLREDVERLRPAADALLMGVDQHLAPPELGARLMATVREEATLRRAAEERPTPAVSVGYWSHSDHNPTLTPRGGPSVRERRRWRSRPRGLVAALAVALVAIAVAGGVLVSGGADTPGSRTLPAQVTTAGGRGVLVIDGRRGGELTLSGVARPGAGRTYQVWLMPKGSTTPTPSTRFTTGPGGSARVHVPGDLQKVDRVLVTNEPAGGSPAPTTTPFISVAV